MDPFTNLYDRLRQKAAGTGTAAFPEEPPQLEDWLRFWNDEDTDLGNLRNFEHWMACSSDRPTCKVGRPPHLPTVDVAKA